METLEKGSESQHESKQIEVEINGRQTKIAGGEYTGRTLKVALAVPFEDELDRVVNHEFKEISNDQKVEVHNGEKFVSHRGQGQSS